MRNLPCPPAEVVHEHNLTTEANDELDVGIIRINDDRQPAAYASLGDTIVSISRGRDGVVRIEIDDTAPEPVHISVKAQALRVDPHTEDGPWHEHE